MSGSTDPFLVLVDDIGALRRQIENLQRTSLDRDEAEHLNATIAQSLDNMAQTGKRLEQRLEGQLQLAVNRHSNGPPDRRPKVTPLAGG